ncbi:DUF4388 domain-containing protein, partial [Myxococcota bacterium]|nr:DUF4388 domain-containing protein [Myxococcota bacterium]
FEVAIALGAKLAASGAQEEAARLLATAEKQAPATYGAQLELGRALRDARALTASIQHLKEAARIKPSAPDPHRELASSFEAAGAIPDAIGALKAATKLAPDDAATHQRLGLLLQKAGQLREAVGALVKAAALAPDDAALHEQLARAMEEKRLRETGPVPALSFAPDQSLGSFGGDLSIFALPEVLEFLVHQQKSGTVRVVSPRGEGSIEMYHGRVVRVRAPKLRSLALVLEELDAATSTDMKRAFAGAVDPADDLAVARRLLDEQLVDEQLISDALGRQALEGLSELVGWSEGQVSFSRMTDPSVVPELSFDTRYLLLEVMRHLDEAKRTTDRT